MIFTDFASNTINKINKIYENTLNLKNNALENTSKEILSKINRTYQKTQESSSLLAGDSSPFGTGYMGDVIVDDAFVFPENDIYNRCILQCKNFYLPAGVTLNIPDCAGFYILCQGDITIDGTILSKDNLVLPNSDKESVNYFELDNIKYIFANGGITRNYKGPITINNSTFTSVIDSVTTTNTWAAQTIAPEVETSIQARHYGGYPASIYVKTFTSGYATNCDDYVNKNITGIVLQELDRKNDNYVAKNLTDTYKLINSKEIKSSASIILISKNNITINGIINASGTYSYNTTSTNYTYSNISSYLGAYGSYGSKSGYQVDVYPYIKFPIFKSFSIQVPSASGGITLLSNSINTQKGQIINNGYKHIVNSTSLSNKTLSSATVTSTATSRHVTENFTMKNITLGGITIPEDVIISTSGEIKIYELGGE